jgi:hypothetical protein
VDHCRVPHDPRPHLRAARKSNGTYLIHYLLWDNDARRLFEQLIDGSVAATQK